MNAAPAVQSARRTRATTRGLAVALLTVAGCGGSTTTTPPGTTATSPATTQAAALVAPPAHGPTAATGQPVSNGVSCERNESFATHIHPGLAIVLDGRRVTVPTDIGVLQDRQCLYWLHTHADRGVLHIESPTASRVFTLGEFFTVWGYPISSGTLLNVSGTIRAWVNGKPFSGDPATIPLRDRESIVLANTTLTASDLPKIDFSEVG